MGLVQLFLKQSITYTWESRHFCIDTIWLAHSFMPLLTVPLDITNCSGSQLLFV